MLLAVTLEQHLLLQVARVFAERHDRWPTADELARDADVAHPIVWAELKVLARLGCVAWRKTVEVVREPDGFFLPLNADHPFGASAPHTGAFSP